MKRRSARLASLTMDTKAPANVARLGSVVEGQESPAEHATQSLDTIMSSPPKPSTPLASAPMKLPMSEMHPSKVHPTMTAAPSSGLKLGFVSVNPNDKCRVEPSGAHQATPSKINVPTSNFTFGTGAGGADLGLGSDAQRMMAELREEAARIKAELTVQREQEQEQDAEQTEGRKFAKARGRAGRFSDAHMAAFRKMDSIANHPSAYRAAPGRVTPSKPGLKRTQSKANLDDSDSALRKSASVRAVPKSHETPRDEPESPLKRIRQRMDDDVSTNRPISRDGSVIPRPKSSGNDSIRSFITKSHTLSNIMTPTKASAAKGKSGVKTPTITLVKSPSKPDIGTPDNTPSKGQFGFTKSPSKPELPRLGRSGSIKKAFGGLTRSQTTNNLDLPATTKPTDVQTPGRFDRVKSILKRQFSASKPKSSIPQPAGFRPKTPGGDDKELPPLPLTTPGQRLVKHVEFTPDTKQAVWTQNSPTPAKAALQKFSFHASKAKRPTSTASMDLDGTVNYPDLSAYKTETVDNTQEDKESAMTPSIPGTFTFRSDHTIQFAGDSSKGFGGAAGQSSLRHVRQSLAPVHRMPGSYPSGRESDFNKENTEPGLKSGIPHGIQNKKRHRAVWEDDELKTGIAHGIPNKKRHRAEVDDGEDAVLDDANADRPAKKMKKMPTAAPPTRLVSSSPIKKPASMSRTPSPQKKRTGMSLSRLQMLAQPKIRK